MTDTESVLSVGTKTDELEDSIADLGDDELVKVTEDMT